MFLNFFDEQKRTMFLIFFFDEYKRIVFSIVFFDEHKQIVLLSNYFEQGDSDKKEINLCNIFFILIFNEFYLFD